MSQCDQKCKKQAQELFRDKTESGRQWLEKEHLLKPQPPPRERRSPSARPPGPTCCHAAGTTTPGPLVTALKLGLGGAPLSASLSSGSPQKGGS